MAPDLRTLGARVRALQDGQLRDAVDLERGQRRLLAAAQGPLGRAPRRRAALVVAFAAVGLIAIGAGTWWRTPAPLRFQIGAGERGRAGDWIVAGEGAPVPLRFADGTELVLMPGTRSLVSGIDEAPRVVVAQGRVRASVIPRASRHWRLQAGPFEVIVTGTKFDLDWQAEGERLSIVLREGKVLVSGPVVGHQRAVSAGETLRVSTDGAMTVAAEAGPLATARDDAAPAAVEAPAGNVVVRRHDPLPAPRRPAQAAAEKAAEAPAPSPFALARANRYAEALAAAEQQGFERLCRSAGAADLVALGDAARLAGNPDRAQVAYTAVRARFDGPLAAQVAFLLGRLSLYERREYAAAARLFDAYLREQPDGPYAREAAGLRAEALDLAGDHAAARSAAASYLARFPDGPFAPRARTLRGSEGRGPAKPDE
jgi:hypothetical protein